MGKKKVENEESINEAMEEYFNDPEVQSDVGYSFGYYHATEACMKAYEMGEIEEFIEWAKPKSVDEWRELEEKYGVDYDHRWLCDDELLRLKYKREENKRLTEKNTNGE